MEKRIYNHLKDENSLYLRQHSENPVNWYPFGPVALEKAREEDKPILLSIGYSSCHWCHVMAHESFEDMETAQLLNDNFVCIKVDREELPDVDSYYQLACQVTTGRGGWPLNAFLTPDLRPFFVGTYFPKESKHNLPSFKELVLNLSNSFKEDRETINQNADQVTEAITQAPKYEQKVEFEGHYPSAASVLNALKNYQDNDWGGYGPEPKFPHFSFMEWAVEHMLEGMVPQEFGEHIIKSIELMLMGGINDHNRGGIHRYAVDQSWKVPHFEKMLYDQAGLLKLLAKASLIYPSPLIFDTIIQTLDYIKYEMLSDDGFFFSAQDADSEGVEGLFFTFTKEEFVSALQNFDTELAKNIDTYIKWFDISDKGNFEDGLNVIALNPQYKSEYFSPEGWTQIRKIRQCLWEERKGRVPPQTDNKGVASWNFQLATALLETVQYSKIDVIQNSAKDLFKKVETKLIDTFFYHDDEGNFRIKTTTTRTGHVPLFEDYVFFAELLFKSYEILGANKDLELAMKTMDFIVKEFVNENQVYTRALSFTDVEPYENLHVPIFDQSYKSSLGTFISLLRKWSLHNEDFIEYYEKLEGSVDTLTHLSLQNPLAFGETLRALVYPDEAYRKIEVPKKWLETRQLMPYLVNFGHRFAICYHERDENSWQICTIRECEQQGSSFDEFVLLFTPPEKQDNA